MTQQSTIEERFNEYFYEGDRNSVMCKKHKSFATPFEIIRFIQSEIQLAEQKAREEEQERIIDIINDIASIYVSLPSEEVKEMLYKDDIINQITNSK